MKNGKVFFFGKILRKTGIDELPQLFNIIKGEMNFIGPRPLTNNDIERLSWNTKYHESRWSTKPGLTGLAQLSPICNKKMSFYLDKYYAENKSIILNFKIFYVSFLTLFIGKNKAKTILFKR
jgi:lipopolysaccharide/colanic/teichoic acid biosynthesis glycosyltransferase